MSNSVVDADVAIGDQRLLAARRCNSSAHAHGTAPADGDRAVDRGEHRRASLDFAAELSNPEARGEAPVGVLLDPDMSSVATAERSAVAREGGARVRVRTGTARIHS